MQENHIKSFSYVACLTFDPLLARDWLDLTRISVCNIYHLSRVGGLLLVKKENKKSQAVNQNTSHFNLLALLGCQNSRGRFVIVCVCLWLCVWAPSEAIANDLICGGNTSRSGRPQTARREPGDSDPLSLRDTQEFVVLRGQLAERRAHWAAPVRI